MPLPNNSASLLQQALLAAGIPVVGVADLGSGNYRIDYDGTQTPAQVAQAATIVAGLNVTTQLALQERSAAQSLLTDPGSNGKALRAVLLVAFNFEVATRTTVNQLVTLINASIAGANVTPLSIPTIAQAETALQNAVAAGQVD